MERPRCVVGTAKDNNPEHYCSHCPNAGLDERVGAASAVDAVHVELVLCRGEHMRHGLYDGRHLMVAL